MARTAIVRSLSGFYLLCIPKLVGQETQLPFLAALYYEGPRPCVMLPGDKGFRVWVEQRFTVRRLKTARRWALESKVCIHLDHRAVGHPSSPPPSFANLRRPSVHGPDGLGLEVCHFTAFPCTSSYSTARHYSLYCFTCLWLTFYLSVRCRQSLHTE